MQKHFKTLVSGLAVFGALAVALTVQAAWSAPAPGTIPPDNNAEAPLNVGATAQTKTGRLNVQPSTGIGLYAVSSDNWGGYFVGSSGVYGYGPANLGVYGNSGSYFGVQGDSAANHGVRGVNAGNNIYTYGGFFTGGGGVYGVGYNASTPGINGYNASYVGVQGQSGSSYGVYGVSNSSIGVRGQSDSNYGGYFRSEGNHGLVGVANLSGDIGVYALNEQSQVFAYLGYGDYSLRGNGSLLAPSYLYSSDKRLKENIAPIKDALAKVLALSGNTFTWKEGERKGESDVGLIAQEVEKVLPDAVSTGPDGYKEVDYPRVVPLLVEAVKEQQRQIDELKSALDSLR